MHRGAIIELGLCLDLTTSIGVSQVKQAHQALSELIENKAYDPPKNSKDLLRRNLDCAVIQMLHKIREQSDEPQLGTVRGLLLEGELLYETAGFHDKTQIQLAVRSLECIKGVNWFFEEYAIDKAANSAGAAFGENSRRAGSTPLRSVRYGEVFEAPPRRDPLRPSAFLPETRRAQ